METNIINFEVKEDLFHCPFCNNQFKQPIILNRNRKCLNCGEFFYITEVVTTEKHFLTNEELNEFEKIHNRLPQERDYSTEKVISSENMLFVIDVTIPEETKSDYYCPDERLPFSSYSGKIKYVAEELLKICREEKLTNNLFIKFGDCKNE